MSSNQAEFDRQEALSFWGHWAKGWFLVLRRGRPSAKLRLLKVSMSLSNARNAFQKASDGMRQGCVILLSSGDSQILDYHCAPMVRTRW